MAQERSSEVHENVGRRYHKALNFLGSRRSAVEYLERVRVLAEDYSERGRDARCGEWTDFCTAPSPDWTNSELRPMQDDSDLDGVRALYAANKLVSIRMGNVESAYALSELENLMWPDHHDRAVLADKMQTNAGMYAVAPVAIERVLDWFMQHVRSIVPRAMLTSCYVFLGNDIPLWATLGVYRQFAVCVSLLPCNSVVSRTLSIVFARHRLNHSQKSTESQIATVGGGRSRSARVASSTIGPSRASSSIWY